METKFKNIDELQKLVMQKAASIELNNYYDAANAENARFGLPQAGAVPPNVKANTPPKSRIQGAATPAPAAAPRPAAAPQATQPKRTDRKSVV
jgi:hypothetical protein